MTLLAMRAHCRRHGGGPPHAVRGRAASRLGCQPGVEDDARSSVSAPLVMMPTAALRPRSAMMLTVSVKNSAPNSAPTNEPRPPVSAAPPSTAAAMLVSV